MLVPRAEIIGVVGLREIAIGHKQLQNRLILVKTRLDLSGFLTKKIEIFIFYILTHEILDKYDPKTLYEHSPEKIPWFIYHTDSA